MEDEENSLYENNVWELVELPKGKKQIKLKWIFDVKTDELENMVRHKARLVAKGFTQREGEYFFELFAPVSKYSTFIFVLALSVENNWILAGLVIKTAFLNAELKEEIYVAEPLGFRIKGS